MTALQQAAERVRDQLTDVRAYVVKPSLVERSGWLPHITSPLHLIDPTLQSTREVSEAIERYYLDNWPAVRAVFESNIAGLNIDEEAKRTFSEALSAHENGLYKSAVSVLFPEIERVGRSVGIPHLNRIKVMIGRLPRASLHTFPHTTRIYNKVVTHMTLRVEGKVDNFDIVANDPVPSRNALMHGLVVYSKHQHSINALIQAHFLFHMLSEISIHGPGARNSHDGGTLASSVHLARYFRGEETQMPEDPLPLTPEEQERLDQELQMLFGELREAPADQSIEPELIESDESVEAASGFATRARVKG